MIKKNTEGEKKPAEDTTKLEGEIRFSDGIPAEVKEIVASLYTKVIEYAHSL